MISVAIDWGSSSFRAYRFNADGQHIDTRQTSRGIKFINGGQFEHYLRDQIGDWINPGDQVLLSGMIGSRNGWLESDYLPCPAALDRVITSGKSLDLPDMKLLFLPGVNQLEPADVMRGEELQLLGASLVQPSGMFVIPGTHSKWAWLGDGTIERFRTIPTGELFDLVTNHSLIGAMAHKGDWDQGAFLDGVSRGYDQSTLLSNLFTTRSRVLLSQQSGEAAYAWLSGLLIGSEIREAGELVEETPNKVILIGSESLCQKYRSAIEHLGVATEVASSSVTLDAFQQIIRHFQEVDE